MSFYVQIFDYIESKAFQVVTISLGLPIILFLIDYIFKFRKNLQKKKNNGN